MSEDAEKSLPNKPNNKQTSKRQAAARIRILQAGRKLYFSAGFSAVTSDMIAAEAAVSKATIYRHFSSMPELFRAVVGNEVGRFGYDPGHVFADLESFEATLDTYCEKLLNFLNNPDVLAFSSLMMAEARTHPESAKIFFEAAYGETLRQLEELISTAYERRIIALEITPARAAEQLLGTLEGVGLLRVHFGLSTLPYPDPEIQARSVVKQFLKSNRA